MYFNFLKLLLKNGELDGLGFTMDEKTTELIKNNIDSNSHFQSTLFDLDRLKHNDIFITGKKEGDKVGAFFKQGELCIEFGDEKTLSTICKYSNIKPHQARVQGSQLIFKPNYLSATVHSMVLLENKFESNAVKNLVKEFCSHHLIYLQDWIYGTYVNIICPEAKLMRLFCNLLTRLNEKPQIYELNRVDAILGSNPPINCLHQLC